MERETEHVQHITGNNNRVAGGAYHESHHYHGDALAQLKWAPTEEQDLACVPREQYFLSRFWFDATREQRAQIIALKQQLDLTVKQIRLLKFSGLLKVVKGQPVKLKSDRDVLVMGLFFMMLIGGLLLIYATLFQLSSLPPWTRVEGFSSCMFAATAFILACFQTSVRPILLLRRCGIRLGQELVAPENTGS